MAARAPQPQSLVGEEQQPLIAIPLEEAGQAVVRYFSDDATADAALPRSVTEEALDTIGAWEDLDWEEMEQELYRIGHENPPTPPIEEA